ncbi:Dot/Icm T4SS effector Zinc-dependent metalloprotease LegP [Pendulispora albinea]|uniref:M12 family metallopeptidase n=1 Tax=Pendulispora albinea TaxID=2741071 RepID=A0ABZ2M5C5_9BACT
MRYFLPLIGVLALGAPACAGETSEVPAPHGDDSATTAEAIALESAMTKDAPVKNGYFAVGNEERVQPIAYSVVGDLAVFEGDIILGHVSEVEAVSEGAAAKRGSGDVAPLGVGLPAGRRRWAKKTVAYTIDSGLPNQARVTSAIQHWRDKTDIEFVQRTSANASSYPDYVTFVKGSGCSSAVGRSGGKQVINLADGCSTGAAIHEIGHAVGLWHEQSREDRDTYVTIKWENIEAGMEHNFDRHVSDGDDLGAYDFNSIMHYGKTAFSKNGQPTIVTKNGQAIGQRTGLSTGDLNAVKILYP